jgi:tetratricopeptide (TPR) repeat protein
MIQTARWAGLALLLAGLTGGPARGQELPQATPEGVKAANELLDACVRDGGLTRVGGGAAAAWRIDPAKLRATLAARRDRLTPAVRDALVVGFDRGNASQRPVFAAVLEAFGQEGKDERALGFAAYFTGEIRQAQGHLTEASAAGRRAARHFAAVAEHGWQAASLNNVGNLLWKRREYAQAEPLLREALALYRKLYPRGHPDLAASLNNLGGLLLERGEYAQAEPLLREALALGRKLYPQGHPHLAASLNNLGNLLRARGEYAQAKPCYREALALGRKLYPQGQPHLAASLNNLGDLLRERGEYAQAEPLLREALALYRKLYPRGHPHLAASLNNLGGLLLERGEYAQAEPLLREALALGRKLYPQGRPHLAASLDALGGLLLERGEYARAEPLLREAVALRRKLYPQGHPYLASSLNNLGALLRERREYAQAEPLVREALALYRKLYPQGHPAPATSLDNLGVLLLERGEYARAEPLLREAVALRRKLYPQGHPYLASSLTNLGNLLHERREYARAEPLLREAVAVYQRHADRLAQSAPEAQALNFAATFPLTRDGYLSATRRLKDHPAADAYALVWQSKAALTRAYQRRHLALRAAAASAKVRSRWRALLDLRRQREVLLLAPAPADPAARDRLLQGLAERVERLERELLPLLPAVERAERLARSVPDDLCKALPPRAALVDLLRYIDIEQDPRKPGREGIRLTPRYVAFVVSRGGVARVELGEAESIERAVADWRAAITAYRPDLPDPAPRHAEAVRRLLWDKLAGQLPAGAEVVYLAPDAALTAVPWAALPGRRPGTVLLEEQALAVLPHGPFLLDRLNAPLAKAKEPGTLLAVGAVRYDDRPAPLPTVPRKDLVAAADRAGPAVGGKLPWAYLEGSARELRCVADLARGFEVRRLAGAEAGAERVLAELPRARVAHLATHGFFADESFRSVMQLDEKLFERTMFLSGGVAERIGEGARSPLVLSGLVLAGANRPDAAGRGILTADAVAGLDLSSLQLAVLSACETCLGDVAGGEGVYGLQRAFHVAGAADVVASLWKVNDEATAALMALFYRNLWQEKLPPLEALRRAQLALYRHPEHIKAWARGERGPDLKRPAPGSGPAAPAGVGPKPGGTAPTKQWAAFVLSGLGR